MRAAPSASKERDDRKGNETVTIHTADNEGTR